MSKRIFFLSLIGCFLFAVDAIAGKRYWIAGSAAYWNNTANWSDASGGTGGFSVPGSSDTVYFDGNGVGNDTIDANVNIKRWEIAAGYTGTIVQRTYTMTIGTSGAVLSGGTFAGGSANITFSGTCTISGCAFTSTSGTFSTNSNFTVSSGSFTHNSGTITITASMTLTSSITGGTTYYDLNFAPTAANSTYTITSTTAINVVGTLSIAGTKTSTFNTGTIKIQGNINTASATAAGGGGTGVFNINGSGAQSITGNSTGGDGRLPDLVINKTGDTLSLYNVISCAGDWTYTAGNVKEGTSVVSFNGGTISGGPTFYSLWLTAGATHTISSGTVTVNGTLGWGGGAGACPVVNSGTISVTGNINMSLNTTTSGSGGTGTISIDGTGNQSLVGSVSGSGRMCNVVINKSSGTLTITNYVQAMKDWTWTSGTLSASGSTVVFDGTKRISGTHSLNNIIFSGGSASTYTIAPSSILTAGGNVSFNGASKIQLDSGTVYANKNVRTTNSSSNSGGNATIVFNGTGTDTLTGSGTAGQGKLPNITIDKSSGSLAMESVISCTGNWIYTQGTVSPGSSSVAFYGNFNLDGQQSGSSNTMAFYRLQVTTGTRTLTGSIDANDNFTISTGATCIAGNYDITVGGNWNSQGTWTYGKGTVTFDGAGYKRIQGASGTTVSFGRAVLDRRSGSLTCVNLVKIDTSMTFSLGRLKTDATNYLHFIDNATCTVSNDDSAYVHGPVRKTGDDAFTFPLGDTTLHDSIAYHPLAISAPGSTSDRFEAVYNAVGQTLGSTIVDSLQDLSTCEKWSLERQVGTSNVLVTLSWNRNSCNTDVYGNMRVANWDGSGWTDLGASAISVLYGGKGTVTSSGNPTYVSNFAYLTTAVSKNNFPTAILHKKLDGGYYKAINGRLFFRFDEEYYDTGDLTFNIYDDEHTLVSSNSMMPSAAQPQVVYGDNRFHLNTVGCEITPSGPLADGFYVLEVINDKNEKWYLRFEQDANIMIGNCPPPTEAE